MTGEFFGFLMKTLTKSGALDVWYSPIYMKKNRPAAKLSVLCHSQDVEKLTHILLNETTTLGVRIYSANRRILDRTIKIVNTKYGPISIKIATGDGISKWLPEYEDCAKAAELNNVPLRDIYNEVSKLYLKDDI